MTEAELRLGAERVRLDMVHPDAVKAGAAADPAEGADAWRPAAGPVTWQAPPSTTPPVAAGQPMAENPVAEHVPPPPPVRL